MSRSKTILQNQFPYHITGRCINREWFNLPMDLVWKVFCDELYMAHIVHDLQIHSFVLISNHYHLIASTPKSNLSKCMGQFSHKTSLRLTRMGNRINQTFAGRYFKSVINQPNYFLNTYKYNYRNPVAAGLCEFVEEYQYSTLHGLLGASKLEVPMVHDDTLFENPEGTLSWLNTKPCAKKLAALKFGLKKAIFEPKKDQNNKVLISIDELI